MIRLVPARRSHIRPIAAQMRVADRREVGAFFSRSPRDGLIFSFVSSQFALTALKDDRPIAMFGLTPISLVESVGAPWLLGTDEVYEHPREMLRLGRLAIGVMHDSFRRLENVVSADNSRAIKLLTRWGFKVGSEVTRVGGVDFVPFRRAIDV